MEPENPERNRIISCGEIDHSRRRHKLVLLQDDPLSLIWCGVCHKEISGDYYGCSDGCRGLNLHKSCQESVEEIKHHSFHPRHVLSLRLTCGQEDFCWACKGKQRDFSSYHCSVCPEFKLHVKCAKLLSNGQDLVQVQLPGHPHPLLLCLINHSENFFTYICSYCDDEIVEEEIYFCVQCHVLLHKSCVNLDKKIVHFLHPQHNMFLSLRQYNIYEDRSEVCSYCRGLLGERWYECTHCMFQLDIKCATLDLIRMPNFDFVKVNHPHSDCLYLFKANKPPPNCDGCREKFTDKDSICYCTECRIWMHESCACLARQIKHPLDQLHSLTLIEKYNQEELVGEGKCYVCEEYVSGFIYQCSHCELLIHVTCATSVTSVMTSTNHRHPLVLFNESTKKNIAHIRCSKCENCCGYHNFFRCLECKFNFHVHCLPQLPITVTSVYHRHPLILTPPPIIDSPDEADDAEFYCDNCETIRNIYEPTYYCQQCHFVSHIRCLLTEVMRILEEEWSSTNKLGDNNGASGKVLLDIDEGLKGKSIHMEGNESEEENASSSGTLSLSSFTGTYSSLVSKVEEIDEVIAELESLRAKILKKVENRGEELNLETSENEE